MTPLSRRLSLAGVILSGAKDLGCRLRYQSGEKIEKGDRILLHDEPGYVKFVADPAMKDAKTDRYVKEYGGDVMVVAPKVFGHVFLPKPEDAELILVSRSED